MREGKKKNKKKKKKASGGTTGSISGADPPRNAASIEDKQGCNAATTGKCDSVPKSSSRVAPKKTWATVVGRRGKKGSDGSKGQQAPNVPPKQRRDNINRGEYKLSAPASGNRRSVPNGGGTLPQLQSNKATSARKVPKLAAVSIFCTFPGQYEAIVAEAKRRIKLSDLGIEKVCNSKGRSPEA